MENLARIIELWTKIPASKIRAQEYEQLENLDTRLKEHIVGQDEAIRAVTAAIRRNRVGISPKKRPVSFIFVGSTGVGKTELVKCLANELFESVESLIRLDMSEYMEKHSRFQAHRLASRLCRLRRGGAADGENPPPAVFRHSL